MKDKLRTLYTVLVCLMAPRFAKPWLLNQVGHAVHASARIGLSFVMGTRLFMGPQTAIGWFNLIACRRLVMRDLAYIGRMNVIKGRVTIRLASRAAIGNRNSVICGGFDLNRTRPSHLILGTLTKITAGHYVECGESIVWGKFGTLAGVGCQMWTHGFVHAETGEGRSFIRGRITIGDNVYIGAHSVIAAGVRIGDAIAVGAHSSVASDLVEPGVYVSAPLKHIARPSQDRLSRLKTLDDGSYWKGEQAPRN